MNNPKLTYPDLLPLSIGVLFFKVVFRGVSFFLFSEEAAKNNAAGLLALYSNSVVFPSAISPRFRRTQVREREESVLSTTKTKGG